MRKTMLRKGGDGSKGAAPDRGSSPSAIGRILQAEWLAGYLFIAPVVLLFLAFVLGPLIAAFGMSFSKYDVLSPPRFVGLDNYIRMLGDRRLLTVYLNTVVYVVAAVVGIVGFGLLFAVMLNRRMPGWMKNLFRAAYFFPSLVALVYVSVIWQTLFQKDTGIVNYYLSLAGLEPVDWLNGFMTSRLSVIIVDVWRNTGFTMLIFVAALQEVPEEVNEAAILDGAGPWSRFVQITLPMISQAVFFNVTMTVIGAFQIYESVVVLTGGGPGDQSRSVTMYITEKAFGDYQMGYAAAVSMSLFAVILVMTLIQFRIRRKWVHHEN